MDYTGQLITIIIVNHSWSERLREYGLGDLASKKRQPFLERAHFLREAV